jgi:hypothetical protein
MIRVLVTSEQNKIEDFEEKKMKEHEPRGVVRHPAMPPASDPQRAPCHEATCFLCRPIQRL